MSCGVHRIFADTNIVQALQWLGPFVWDGDETVLSSAKFLQAGSKAQDDYLALRALFGSPRGLSFELLVSERSVAELAETPSDQRRSELLSWITELLDYQRQASDVSRPTDYDVNIAIGLRQLHLLDLPDEIDRELIAEAAMYRCDTFLTLDRRTIVTKTDTLKLLTRWTGLNVLRPSEAWTKMKPWAGLMW